MARALVTCALFGACAPGGSAARAPAPSRAAAAPAPARAPTPPPAVLVEASDAGAVPADAARSTAALDAGAPEASPAPPPRVVYEHPYKLYERLRPKGDVYAAGQDELLARWNVGGNGDPAFKSNRPRFHPGARVIVDVQVPPRRLPKHAPYDRRKGRYRRVLSETAVLAQARRRGYWPFRMCFEDGLRRDQHIHGKVRFETRVARDGHVDQARVTQQKLSDDTVRQCLLDRVRALTFVPGPSRSLHIGLSVELWPGDAPVPSTDAPPDAADDNPGELDVAAIERAALPAHAAIEECYAAGLARDAALWGRVQVQIELDAAGRTRRVRETESHLPDREVAACVVGALKQSRFPSGKAGPLIFIYGVRLGNIAPITATPGNSETSDH